jgi:hypothetical protein
MYVEVFSLGNRGRGLGKDEREREEGDGELCWFLAGVKVGGWRLVRARGIIS